MTDELLKQFKISSSLPHIPKEERKTILLLSDDCRMHSGVGVMSREIILGTAHRYNWIQLGAGINHPEAGKGIDLSQETNKLLGIDDSYVRVLPYNGYGDQAVIRYLLKTEKLDAIMHFTDPRFWIWLYQMEHEVRSVCPILFYHVWDDTPFPKYNESYYRSCDSIYTISKQTHNIVRNVWKTEPPEPWQVKYIPHGVNSTLWRKFTDVSDLMRVDKLKQQLFKEDADTINFIVLYNNRNIRRKATSDVILAYRDFLRGLPKHKQDQCRLLLHTTPVDEHGTDLYAVLNDLAPDVKYVFSPVGISSQSMVDIYNMSDVVINLANAEGFGIGTLEALMTERMIIANVTGGLQDQMGFRDENNTYLDPEIHFNSEWATNADGKYTTHGEWVLPIFPKSRTLIGSPPTPYIFEDHADYRDAAVAITSVYNMTPEERSRRGKLGREYVIEIGMTSNIMSDRFIDAIDTSLANWKPRKQVGLYKVGQ